MRGVRQHRIGDLPDAIGLVVPRLVDEVGVRGDRVDLAARLLEVGILVLQVLELRGADEGKVRGIKEENTPLPKNIRLRDGLELTVMVRLNLEIANFFVDHGHQKFLLKICVGSSDALFHCRAELQQRMSRPVNSVLYAPPGVPFRGTRHRRRRV